MREFLVLYSTNTWLGYVISQRYYNAEHYVWCTPYFDPRNESFSDSAVPPTSGPLEIFLGLHEEVKRGDRHSHKIKENRVGILRGASVKRQAGVIDEDQEREIAAVLKLAQVPDFRPLMYVIPYSAVADILREPPVEDKAHPLSAEFIIDRLPRKSFDIIEFGA